MTDTARHEWSWKMDTFSTGHWECDKCGAWARNDSEKRRGMGRCRGYRLPSK